MAKKTQTRSEQYRVHGENLLHKIQEIVREGNARRIIIKDDAGEVLIEVPLTIGAIGVLAVPVVAAIGAFAALASNCTIVVERRAPTDQ